MLPSSDSNHIGILCCHLVIQITSVYCINKPEWKDFFTVIGSLDMISVNMYTCCLSGNLKQLDVFNFVKIYSEWSLQINLKKNIFQPFFW